MGKGYLAIAVFFWATAASAGPAAVSPDTFEPDDSPEEAQWLAVDGPAQTHNFHVMNDEDWLRFYSADADIITIETFDLGANSDTYLEVYDATGQNLLDSDAVVGAASAIDLAVNEGFYLIRVVHESGGFGEGTEYSIRAFREIGSFPGTLTGVVYDAESQAAIPDATVRLVTFGGVTTLCDNDGVYAIDLPENSYMVEASAPGYASQSRMVMVESLVIVEADFALESSVAAIPGDVNGSGAVDAADIQLVINAALGLTIGSFDADVTGDTLVNAADVQTVINISLGIA